MNLKDHRDLQLKLKYEKGEVTQLQAFSESSLALRLRRDEPGPDSG